MIFGKKLKALREAAGLTQAGLAQASRVPLGTIRDYEQVKRDPSLSVTVKLARALKVSTDVFADCFPEDGAARKRRGQPRKGK